MADYKGIYYNNDSSEKYFEGGAHFRYKQLYKILEKYYHFELLLEP